MSTGPTPVDSLTDEEKEKVRYHLGYLATSFAPSISLGIPRPLQTVFLLEQGLTLLVNGFAVNRVRCILKILDDLECKLVGGVTTLAAETLGELTLHPLRERGKTFTDSLEDEYRRWAGRLADIFGVPLYPYAARFKRRGPGTVVSVRG
jgi:hypothetical protein